MSKIKLIVAWIVAGLSWGAILALFFYAMYKAISGFNGSLVDIDSHKLADLWNARATIEDE